MTATPPQIVQDAIVSYNDGCIQSRGRVRDFGERIVTGLSS
jgi:hypothetical protein